MKLFKLKLKKENICAACVKCSFVLLVITLSLQVAITNKYAVKGSEMVSLIDQEQNLIKEVSLLKLDISEVSSMAYIEERALELGFEEYVLPMAVIGSAQFAALSDF